MADRIGVLPERAQLVQHLAFEALQMLERHVREVAAAAGRIEHAGGAELVVKAAHFGAGLVHPAFVGEQHGRCLRVGPVGAQRLHHRRQHQPLDIRARRVVRAERVALVGAKRAFERRAEDGGLDLAPVGVGRAQQAVDLLAREWQHVAIGTGAFEELAVEAQHVALEHGAEAPAVHVGTALATCCASARARHGGAAAAP